MHKTIDLPYLKVTFQAAEDNMCDLVSLAVSSHCTDEFLELEFHALFNRCEEHLAKLKAITFEFRSTLKIGLDAVIAIKADVKQMEIDTQALKVKLYSNPH